MHIVRLQQFNSIARKRYLLCCIMLLYEHLFSGGGLTIHTHGDPDLALVPCTVLLLLQLLPQLLYG